ncbi:MAG TPA: putative porin [Tardiphaga sp.]
MLDNKSDAARLAAPLALSLCALAWTVPALAQDAAKRPAVSRAKPTSPNATINLVNMLVKQGVLKEEQAQALIKQADDEAYVARESAKVATVKADEAAKVAGAAAAAASPPGTRHVTYVPEIVKRQLRDEIRRDVMAKAEKENWASPGKYPEWAQRIRFSGDLRVRYENQSFPTGNDPRAYNFNAINTGSPYDISTNNSYYAPTGNASEERNRTRLRARLGADIDITNQFSAGMRFASGDSNSPVSTNQTFGSNGGNFSKYALWIDRAYLRYEPWNELNFSVGRFDNPFWSPTDLVYHRDLGFDGFAVQAKREIWEGVTPFVVAGAFPIYNTDLNAGINLPDPSTGLPSKYPSRDKWLFGGQVGVGTTFAPHSAFRVAVAYYDFTNVQGQLSTPCSVFSSSDSCSTDLSRPSFAQKGNTYAPLRNIIRDAANGNGATNQFQYFGLASEFRPLVVSGQLDLGEFHPVHVVLDGEYVKNTGFDRAAIEAISTNNNASAPAGSVGRFEGGDTGWMARATVGHKQVRQLWDWNVHIGYKYLESDAVIDAFADSDFGLGGTNLKGYFIGGNVGVADNVWVALRYLSATNIASSPYAVDIVQLDLNAKF